MKANRDLQILVDLRRDLQIIVERQRSRYPSPSSRDLQLSPRADAASNLHVAFRLEAWLSALARGDRAQMRWVQKAAEDTTANVTDWMMRWDLARNGLWHASHASCRAGQADAVRGSEDDRVDVAYADAVRIYVDLSCVQQRTAGDDVAVRIYVDLSCVQQRTEDTTAAESSRVAQPSERR